jgi:glycosyltransferase involved in cell wall biosynthesis
MPKVTVLLPCYNHAHYVAQAIKSVLDQTFTDFELIILDNGSTDSSWEVITQFRDPRIRLLRNARNVPPCAMGNRLMREGTGDYIASVFSDDAFTPDKLRRQVEILDARPEVAAAFCYTQVIDREGNYRSTDYPYQQVFRQENRSRQDWLKFFFFKGNCLCNSTLLIRRRHYEALGNFDPRFVQLPDFEYWVRLCAQYEIHVIPENLHLFRVVGDELNESGNTSEKNARMYFELAQVLKHYLREPMINDAHRIFGEYLAEIPEESSLAAFKIAQFASSLSSPIHRYFGTQALFEMLEDPALAEEVAHRFGFDWFALNEVVLKADPLNLLAYNHSQSLTQVLQTETVAMEAELLHIHQEHIELRHILPASKITFIVWSCPPNIHTSHWEMFLNANSGSQFLWIIEEQTVVSGLREWCNGRGILLMSNFATRSRAELLNDSIRCAQGEWLIFVDIQNIAKDIDFHEYCRIAADGLAGEALAQDWVGELCVGAHLLVGRTETFKTLGGWEKSSADSIESTIDLCLRAHRRGLSVCTIPGIPPTQVAVLDAIHTLADIPSEERGILILADWEAPEEALLEHLQTWLHCAQAKIPLWIATEGTPSEQVEATLNNLLLGLFLNGELLEEDLPILRLLGELTPIQMAYLHKKAIQVLNSKIPLNLEARDKVNSVF